MSVFDIFKQAAPKATGTPNAQANSVASNPTVPSPANTPPGNSETGEPAPLAKYDELWKTDPNDKVVEPFSFNSDPNKLMETAKTVDFTKIITPEMRKAIMDGGNGAQEAMIAGMNSVAQLTFAQATNAATKISEQAVATMEQRFKDSLPDLIRQHQVSDSLRTTNPLLNNPAAAPMVDALQTQFGKKYPKASSEEIKAHVNDYLNSVADLVVSQRPKPATKQSGRVAEDWSKFVS